MSYNSNKLNATKFEVLNNGDIKVENACLLMTNFAGKPTKFNPAGGRRTFCILLEPEIADYMEQEGWNVKRRDPREEGDAPFIYTEVVVNMNSHYPPEVYLRSECMGKPSMVQLDADTVGNLDDIQIESADLVLHPYKYDLAQGKVKGYVKYINVAQIVNNYFGDKYAAYTGNDENDPF